MVHRLIDELQQKIDEVQGLYYRLILVISPIENAQSFAFKTLAEQANWGVFNVNLELSRRMLTLTARQRALKTHSLLNDLIVSVENETILLTNINLLFDPALRQDPLRLLQNLSRYKTVIAIWEGTVQEQYLSYAEPEHPEYRRYSTRDLILISLASMSL